MHAHTPKHMFVCELMYAVQTHDSVPQNWRHRAARISLAAYCYQPARPPRERGPAALLPRSFLEKPTCLPALAHPAPQESRCQLQMS